MSTGNFDDNMPKIVLEKEDREAYQRTRSQGKEKSGKQSKKDPANDPAPTGSKPSPALWLLVIVSLAACAGLYYQGEVRYEQLMQAQQRINDLEQRLSATGEEMGESTVAMQVKVKELAAKADELWNQMDKLWASAWRRNQQEIKDLGKVIEKQALSDKKQFTGINQSVATNQSSLKDLQQNLSTQIEQLAVVDMTLSQVALTGSEREIEIAALSEKLSVLEGRNSALQKRLNDLENWAKQQPARQTASQVKATPPPRPASSQANATP